VRAALRFWRELCSTTFPGIVPQCRDGIPFLRSSR
jgi:hypothetical protein